MIPRSVLKECNSPFLSGILLFNIKRDMIHPVQWNVFVPANYKTKNKNKNKNKTKIKKYKPKQTYKKSTQKKVPVLFLEIILLIQESVLSLSQRPSKHFVALMHKESKMWSWILNFFCDCKHVVAVQHC